MESFIDNQAFLTLLNTGTLFSPEITCNQNAILGVSPITSATSESQDLYEWLNSISYGNESDTLAWAQQPCVADQHVEGGVFASPSLSSDFIQSPGISHDESVSDSMQSPLATSSPHASHPHSTYYPNSQHQYLLQNNFLTPEQANQRALLQQCLQSSWLNANKREPNDMPKRSVLLGFLTQHTSTAAFKCEFDGCGKEFERQDRALGHIRMHLSHRPYICKSQCGNATCVERFCCRSYLQSHLTRQKEPCRKCGKALFRQNMRRHVASCSGTSSTA